MMNNALMKSWYEVELSEVEREFLTGIVKRGLMK